jgi:hypothetical protein
MRLDSYGVTAPEPTRGDSEYEDGTPKLIESGNLRSRADDAFKDCFGLATVRVSHSSQIRDAKHTHDIAFPDGLAIDVLDAP